MRFISSCRLYWTI